MSPIIAVPVGSSFEKKPIAILHYKKEKFYISENIDLINYIDLEDFKNLPSVFGSKKAFKSFTKT